MNITASYKDSFIEAVISANKEIFTYINNQIELTDYQYTNIIGFGGDDSLKMDLYAEKVFFKYLSSFGNIFSEEYGFLDNNSEFTIIIDPLDGSNNFYSNLPYFGTSVALKKDEKTIAGFVTNLSTGIIKYRVFEDEVKYFSLHEMKEKIFFEQNKTKLAIFERAYEYPKICENFSDLKIKFRCLGAVALSLCEANNFEFVLYMGNIRDFDIEAALYICKDLYIFQTPKTLLIAKSKEKFDLIKETINQ